MMKARVIKQYRDKYTKKSRHIGDEIEVEEQRFEELLNDNRGAFVEAVAEDEAPEITDEEVETVEEKPAVETVEEKPAVETEEEKPKKKTTKKAGKGA